MPGVFTRDDVVITSADGAAGFTAQGATELGNSDNDYSANRREGVTVLDFGKSGSGSGGYSYDLGSASSDKLDMTAEDVTWPFLYTAKTGEVIDSESSSVSLRVMSAATRSTTNYAEFYLNGAVDGGRFFPPLLKSWNFYVLSGASGLRTPDVEVGIVDYSSIRYLEWRYEWITGNSGNQEPAFAADWVKRGKLVTISSGSSDTPAGFEDLQEWNNVSSTELSSTNVLSSPDEGKVFSNGDIFTELWLGLTIGSTTNSTTTYFAAENRTIWNNQYSEQVKHDCIINDNATFRLGKLDVRTQESYAINGCTYTLPDERRIADFLLRDGGNFECYGSKIFRWDDVQLGATTTGTAATADIIGSDFDKNKSIKFQSTGLVIQDTIFHDPLPTRLDAASAWRDDAGVYTDITGDWNNSSTSTTLFPATESTGDGTIFGSTEQFGAVEFEFVTAGSGGAVTWQYWGSGSSTWEDLTGVVDGSSGFTSPSGAIGSSNRVRTTWSIPSDWGQTQLAAEGQRYYIRARIDTTYGTNPVLLQGQIGQRRIGEIVDAPETLENVQFFNCDRGPYFRSNVTLESFKASDNAYDIVADDGLTITLDDSDFDPDKILQI